MRNRSSVHGHVEGRGPVFFKKDTLQLIRREVANNVVQFLSRMLNYRYKRNRTSN